MVHEGLALGCGCTVVVDGGAWVVVRHIELDVAISDAGRFENGKCADLRAELLPNRGRSRR